MFACHASGFFRMIRRASVCESQVTTAFLPSFPWETQDSSQSAGGCFSQILYSTISSSCKISSDCPPEWYSWKQVHSQYSFSSLFLSPFRLSRIQSLPQKASPTTGLRRDAQLSIPIWNMFNVCLLVEQSLKGVSGWMLKKTMHCSMRND